MKLAITLVVLALFGMALYVINNHSPFQTKVTDPYYVEIRIDFNHSDVQLVGVSKMNSFEDCQARALIVWVKNLDELGRVKVASKCSKELPHKYMKLFENKASTATYVAFDKGGDGERDGRFLIYGIPSSHVYRECEKITAKAKQNFSGKVYCVQGTVG